MVHAEKDTNLKMVENKDCYNYDLVEESLFPLFYFQVDNYERYKFDINFSYLDHSYTCS